MGENSENMRNKTKNKKMTNGKIQKVFVQILHK